MQVINHGGKQLLAFENPERIALELEQAGVVVVPAAQKHRALRILAEQKRGNEVTRIQEDQYFLIKATEPLVIPEEIHICICGGGIYEGDPVIRIKDEVIHRNDNCVEEFVKAVFIPSIAK